MSYRGRHVTSASFIKFTTNLLSAAIKDAVFVGAAQKFLEERPIPLQSGPVSPRPACARCLPACPLRLGRPARSPDGACFPISRSVSRPRFRSDRSRERDASVGRPVGLMRRQRPIERTAVVVVVVRALFPSDRRRRNGDNGDRSAVRPLIID